MHRVWNEVVSQAMQMRNFWRRQADVRLTHKHTRRFTLNVLSANGFGDAVEFDPPKVEQMSGDLSYAESLRLILDNCVLVLAFGSNLFTGRLRAFLPKKWALIASAMDAFVSHVNSIIEKEQVSVKQGAKPSNNFIGALVHASFESQHDSGHGQGARRGLSQSEIIGNIFVFNFAGHDSSAITLQYLILHMAAHPQIQDWVAEEIQKVCGEFDDGMIPYAAVVPKLIRCKAIIVSIPVLFGVKPHKNPRLGLVMLDGTNDIE